MITNIKDGRGEYDWQAGANSAIQRRVLLESRNWKELSIPNELQFIHYGQDNGYDSMMCVAFNGTTDALEYIMMQQLRLGLIPPRKVTWLKEKGYFENGVLNFNERFSATLGETDNKGAYLHKVANAIRNYGLIPQKMFAFADNFYDNIDKKFITKEMFDLGNEFKTLFQINYEWVDSSNTSEYLAYSPLACTGRYAVPENEIPLDPKTGGKHSMLLVYENEAYREIDDSYWQQFKKYKHSALENFMAFYVDATENIMFDRDKFIKDHDMHIIRNTANGAYAVIYQNKPLLISQERAGLFILDREARGILSKYKVIQLNAQEWAILNVKDKF